MRLCRAGECSAWMSPGVSIRPVAGDWKSGGDELHGSDSFELRSANLWGHRHRYNSRWSRVWPSSRRPEAPPPSSIRSGSCLLWIHPLPFVLPGVRNGFAVWARQGTGRARRRLALWDRGRTAPIHPPAEPLAGSAVRELESRSAGLHVSVSGRRA